MKTKIIVISVLIGLLAFVNSAFVQTSTNFKLVQSKYSDQILSFSSSGFKLTETKYISLSQVKATSKNYVLNGPPKITSVNLATALSNLSLPTEFVLKQNYPNPFNPETMIEYELPRATKVKLTIHNVLGQLVRTIIQNEQVSGTHQVCWDGKNDQGLQLPNGVYIYRLVADQFTQQRKCILLK